MPTNNIRFQDKKIGIVKTTAWGTATEPSTGNRFPLVAFTPGAVNFETYINSDESGISMPTCKYNLYQTQVNLSGSMKFRYEGGEIPLACAFGYYDVGTPPESGVVRHEYTWNSTLTDAIDSLLHTIAWDEGTEVKVIPSVVLSNLTIGNDSGYNLGMEFIGDKISISGYSSPLGVTSTSPCGEGLFKHSQLQIRMNSQSGGALSSGDVLTNISSCQIIFSRGLEALAQSAGSDSVAKPEENLNGNIVVNLTFSKKTDFSAGIFAQFVANPPGYYKMDFTWTGETISGKTSAYSFTLSLPKVTIDSIDYASATPTETTASFSCMLPSSAPTGMSSIWPTAVLINTTTGLSDYPSAT